MNRYVHVHMYKILLLKKFIKVDGKNKQNTETPKQTNIKRFKTSIMKLVFTGKAIVILNYWQ